jgi:hypothetical protein
VAIAAKVVADIVHMVSTKKQEQTRNKKIDSRDSDLTI